jgi:hypothetical protein
MNMHPGNRKGAVVWIVCRPSQLSSPLAPDGILAAVSPVPTPSILPYQLTAATLWEACELAEPTSLP